MPHWARGIILSRNFLLVKFLALVLFMTASHELRAAELVMFKQAGCPWCEAFDREIAPVYGKTEEGGRAPLRRLDIARDLPPDLAFLSVERLTPLFVLVDQGREIGRIRGYPGEDHFWGLLSVLIEKLDRPGTGDERVELPQKPLHVSD